MLPSFKVPEGYDTEGYFRHVAREGLERRFEELRSGAARRSTATRTAKRLEMELDVIAKMKFPGYFLIVWDFIRYAKENGIPVGPGRGSGAGSIVAYAMRITDLDPIPYNLLFERFLNPERVSMPDFDIDFCMDRRDQVIAYVQKKYGEDERRADRDVRRAEGQERAQGRGALHRHHAGRGAADPANLIPRKTPAETYTIAESLEVEPKLKARYDTEPRTKELLDQAQKLEGLTRHAGKHAAGIVISEGPLWDHVPVFKDEKSGGVRHAVLQGRRRAGRARQVRLPRPEDAHRPRHRAAPHQRAARPADSAKTQFDLARHPAGRQADLHSCSASGETKGVFQLESSGMQQLFKDLKADCFEDIVAAVALYRPGPLGAGMVTDFVNRKNGREADREDAPARRRAPRADLRRHRLPGAGHADRPGARRLLARRRRPPPPRDGQEEARGDGEAEERSSSRAR